MRYKQERQFGFILAAILTLVCLWPTFRGNIPHYYLLIIIAPLVLLGLFMPSWLSPILKWWMFLARIIGWINTKVLLTIVFVFIVTPIALMMRLFGHDELHLKNKQQESYWIARTEKLEKNFLERQY